MAKFDNSRGGFDVTILPRRRRRQEEHTQSIFAPGAGLIDVWHASPDPAKASYRSVVFQPRWTGLAAPRC